MRIERITFLLLVVSAVACVSAPHEKRTSVDVYETDMASPSAARRMPEGCRLLAATGPVDQMESERAMDDPYKRQRSETLKEGGHVLIVLSERTVTRPNLDCPSGDSTADCLRRGQSWYRLRFGEYVCAPEKSFELMPAGMSFDDAATLQVLADDLIDVFEYYDDRPLWFYHSKFLQSLSSNFDSFFPLKVRCRRLSHSRQSLGRNLHSRNFVMQKFCIL